MRIINCTDPGQAERLLKRESSTVRDVEEAVAGILADVRVRGDDALFEYARRFDKAVLTGLIVEQDEIEAAAALVGPETMDCLRKAAQRISDFHQQQVRQGFELQTAPGIQLGQRVLPLDRVGVYIPGGTASYPSTILMNVLPAKIAGVAEIIAATPPSPDGTVNPVILAAAAVAGVSRIFKMGGAQAVAAMTWGTQTVPRVDKITGPGNTYVATAKRMVFGEVGIDMIAGPSEILIIADAGANPDWIAADLLSQAEHDALARAILVTDSSKLAQEVSVQIAERIKMLPRREIAQKSLTDHGCIILTDRLQTAVEIANVIAPEHLEIMTAEPFPLMEQIRHAGSVFLGSYTPEAAGDYLAGPNHTLPTGGTARFSSPLSVDDFTKKMQYLCYDRSALIGDIPVISALARLEGLEGHARSAESRLQEPEEAKESGASGESEESEESR